MPTDTYDYNVSCENCQNMNTITIEKGTTVAEASATAICASCGCNVKQ